MTYLVIARFSAYETSIYECHSIGDLREALGEGGRLNYLFNCYSDITIAKVFKSGEESIKKWLVRGLTKTRVCGICSTGKKCKECGSIIKNRQGTHMHKDLCANCSEKYK